MRKHFRGYYTPSEAEFQDLWQSAVFAFDANVLLNAYRYTADTRNELFDAIASLGEKAWLPYQAGLEFHRNRHTTIAGVRKVYKTITQELDRHLKAISDGSRRHPYLESGMLPKLVAEFVTAAKDEVGKADERHPDFAADDPVLKRITDLFESKVGDDYDEKRKAEIFKDGERRYSRKTPPGWKDESKGEARQFGDLLIWRQIIDHATKVQKPVVFVSDDRKEDWWWEVEGRTLGPRPELIQEMNLEGKQAFWMYPPDLFMRRAAEQTKSKEPTQAIEEVKNVRESREVAAKQRLRVEMTPAWRLFFDTLSKPSMLEEAFRRAEIQRMALAKALAPEKLTALERALLKMSESLPDYVALEGTQPEPATEEGNEEDASNQGSDENEGDKSENNN